jgi:hypothetical protein
MKIPATGSHTAHEGMQSRIGTIFLCKRLTSVRYTIGIKQHAVD